MAKQLISIKFDEEEKDRNKEKATYDAIKTLSNEIYKKTFESVKNVKKISSKIKEAK